MNDDIGAQHPLPSDPSSFSEVPAGQHLTLGRMAEILRASGCVVYASKAAIERLPEAFITSNSGDGKYYVKIAVKSMADLYKWHDAAIIAARGPDVEPYAWQYAKSNGDDTWSIHIDRLATKPAVHENFEPKALYLAGSLPYLSPSPTPSRIEDVAPSEAEIEEVARAIADADNEDYMEDYHRYEKYARAALAKVRS